MSTDSIKLVLRDFYRFRDAKEILGISKITLWRWIKAGKIEAHRIGREVLLEKTVVDALRK